MSIIPQYITMITEYIDSIMQKAHYEIIPEDGTYYGEIPGCTGVWANADTLEACRKELQEVLEEWILIKVRTSKVAPSTNTYDLDSLLCHN